MTPTDLTTEPVQAPLPAVVAPVPRTRGMGGRPRTFQAVLSVLLFVVVAGAWELVARLGLISKVVLPPASDVFTGFITLVTAEWFPHHLVTTLIETVLGFVAAGLFAIGLAAALYHLPLARGVVQPYIILFQLTPSVVLAPVFIIWFGFGLTSKVLVAVSTAFFVMLITALAGFDSTPASSLALMRSLRASKWQIFWMLILRHALPAIFTGLKTATSLALIGALVAEFISSQAGLGTLLTQFGFGMQQDMVFATVIVVALLGIACYGLVEFLQRRIAWWSR